MHLHPTQFLVVIHLLISGRGIYREKVRTNHLSAEGSPHSGDDSVSRKVLAF